MQSESEGVGHLDDGGKAGVSFRGQGLVETFAAHPGLPRDLAEVA